MKSNKQNRAYKKALVLLHKSLLLVALVLPAVFVIISHTVFDFENSGVFFSCYLFVLVVYVADFFEFREVYDEYLNETSEEEKK